MLHARNTCTKKNIFSKGYNLFMPKKKYVDHLKINNNLIQVILIPLFVIYLITIRIIIYVSIYL